MILKPAIYGAYTELYAAVSPDLTLENDNGSFIIPWGRKGVLPGHISKEMDQNLSAGSGDATSLNGKGAGNGKKEGLSTKFWNWCERETRAYW